MTVWKLDFGEGEPAAGYQGVSSSTFFHLEREFGWTDRSIIETRNRRADSRILGRFVAATSPATLRVILDPGKYILQVIMGDKDYSDHVLHLKLSDTDEIFPELTAEAGEYAVLRAVIDVPVSFLELTFSSPVNNWILNSVTLEPDPGGSGTAVTVTRRKFSDRLEESVASEHVTAKGDDTRPTLKRCRGDLADTDKGEPFAASRYKGNTSANSTRLTEQYRDPEPHKVHVEDQPNSLPQPRQIPCSVACGPKIADRDGRQDVITRMICVIKSLFLGGAA